MWRIPTIWFFLRWFAENQAGLGGLVVIVLEIDLRFTGSNPAEDDGIFKEDRNP
jgi:hypothetical protein